MRDRALDACFLIVRASEPGESDLRRLTKKGTSQFRCCFRTTFACTLLTGESQLRTVLYPT